MSLLASRNPHFTEFSHHRISPFPPLLPSILTSLLLLSMAPRELCPDGTLRLVQSHVPPRIQKLFAKAEQAMRLAEEAAKCPLPFVDWRSLPLDAGMKCSACAQLGFPCTFQLSTDGPHASACDRCFSSGAQCRFIPPFATRPVVPLAKTCTSCQSAHQCCTMGQSNEKCSRCLRHDLPCHFQVSIQGRRFSMAPQSPVTRWVTSCLLIFH